jgi:hypothetical protein
MIEHEQKPWGVRLISQPLTGRTLRIVGEIDKPKGTKAPEGRFWFDGALSDKPLRITELMIWQQELIRFIDAAKDVSAQMLAKARKKRG